MLYIVSCYQFFVLVKYTNYHLLFFNKILRLSDKEYRAKRGQFYAEIHKLSKKLSESGRRLAQKEELTMMNLTGYEL